MSSSSDPHSTVPEGERRRHDLRTTLTIMRLRTQLLARLAAQEDNTAWGLMTTGLTALDADLTTLLGQLDHHDGPE